MQEGSIKGSMKQALSLWTPETEAKFQDWYKRWAMVAGLDPNPDNPAHKYDYRAAYRAGEFPRLSDDGYYHWPSEYKHWDHPNRYVEGMDTKYNMPIMSRFK